MSLVQISYILRDRNFRFGVYMYLGMTECHISFSGHCDLDLLPIFKNYCSRSLSPIFFEIGIPNLVCRYILGWRSVVYHFWVTLTFTFDLVFRIIVPRAYLILFEV